MRTITLTSLREKIFSIFDEVSETGKPIFVKRKGHLIKIDLVTSQSRTERLFEQPFKNDAINGDPNELIDYKAWEWNENI